MEFSTSSDARKDVAPKVSNDSQPNWLEGHVLNPFANAIAVTPYNAVANAVNFVSPGDPLGKAESLPVSKTEFLTPDWFVQNVSSGLGAIVPYVLAGKAAGAAMRGTASKFALNGPVARAMTGELGAAATGAAMLDFARDTHEGETRIGNAVGGAVAMFAFTKGNMLTGAAEGMLQKGVTRFGVGTVGGMAGYAGNRLASGESLNGEELVKAGITGGTMNVALPPTQHFITKGFEHAGSKVSETWNSKPVKDFRTSDRVMMPYWRVKGTVRDAMTDAREATYGFLNRHDLPHHPVKDLMGRMFSRTPQSGRPELTAENNPARAFEEALPKYFERMQKLDQDWEANVTGNRHEVFRQSQQERGDFVAKLMEVWHGKDGRPGMKDYTDAELATEGISVERVAQIRNALQQPVERGSSRSDKLTDALVELAPNKHVIEDTNSDFYAMDGIEFGRMKFYGYDADSLMKNMSMPPLHRTRDNHNQNTPHDWMPYNATPELANLFHGTMSGSLKGALKEGSLLPSRELRLRGLTQTSGESFGNQFGSQKISLTRDFNEAYIYHRHSPQYITEFPVIYGISKDVAPRLRSAGSLEPGELLIQKLGIGHSLLSRLGLRNPDITNMYVPDAEVQNVTQQLWANRISGVKVVGFNQMPKPQWHPEPTVQELYELGYRYY